MAAKSHRINAFDPFHDVAAGVARAGHVIRPEVGAAEGAGAELRNGTHTLD